MKKILVLCSFLTISIFLKSQENQSIMSIDNKPIDKEYFLYLYKKNNIEAENSLDSFLRYFELFKNFKLKVFEAQNLGYDTISSFKNELNSYKNQVAEDYLKDKQTEDLLSREAYRHLTTDVEFSQIMVALPPGTTPADTLKAYKKTLAIMAKLERESFESVAKTFSDDSQTKSNGGYSGWFNGITSFYSLERAIYNTPVGNISQPFRTPFGYCIVKVLNNRKTKGKILVAHILQKYPEDATDEDKRYVRNQIFEIYDKIKGGEDFAKKAKERSEDQNTSNNGGVLPWFGVGKMVVEFDKAAFALENIGDISQPVETKFGWHIIKLIDKKAVDSYEDSKDYITQTFRNNGRNKMVQKNFLDKLRKDYNVVLDQKSYEELLTYASKFERANLDFATSANKLQKTVLTIDKKNITQSDFAEFIYSRHNNEPNVAQLFRDSKEDFIDSRILVYEKSLLDKKYPEYKNLINEYHDGILLFNISSNMIWDRATTDTIGLDQYFRANINNYKWQEPRYKGTFYFCKDKKTTKLLKKMLKKMSDSEVRKFVKTDINKDSLRVAMMYGLWERGSNHLVDKLVFKDNNATFDTNEDFPFVETKGTILKELPDNYRDVINAVSSDYQNYLEESWIRELRKKYNIVVNPEAVEEAKKELNIR